MATGFMFNAARVAAAAGTYLLGSSASYYVCLVTTAPTASSPTNPSGLTQVSGGSYAPVALTGVTNPTGLTSGVAPLTATNPVFSGLYATASTAVVGYVIARCASGSTINQSSDYCISYEPLVTVNSSATISSVTTYNGLPVLTAAAGAFSDVVVGSTITGTGIPGSTTVLSISSDGSSLLMSANATASGTVTVTTTTNVATTRTMPTTSGGAINLTITLPSTGLFYF